MSHGNSFYRQLLQVPLIVRGLPHVPAGRYDLPTESIDVMPFGFFTIGCLRAPH